jgi:hypothetical protein
MSIMDTPGIVYKKLGNIWESISDDNSAANLFRLIKCDGAKPGRRNSSVFLCSRCKAIDSTQLSVAECDISKLNKWTSCDLCALLFKASERESITGVVKLRRNGAIVGVKNGPNLLSIYVEPGV